MFPDQEYTISYNLRPSTYSATWYSSCEGKICSVINDNHDTQEITVKAYTEGLTTLTGVVNGIGTVIINIKVQYNPQLINRSKKSEYEIKMFDHGTARYDEYKNAAEIEFLCYPPEYYVDFTLNGELADHLDVQVESKYGTHEESVDFGMRDFRVEGKRFLVNGRETFLRGTVENCLFPQTGYPPMDTQAWERIFRICRSYGLNHMRFHSWCPPKAAFEAADLVGFYLQPEGPSWPNFNVRLGNGMSIDSFLMEETQRLNKAYGNHASFCSLPATGFLG